MVLVDWRDIFPSGYPNTIVVPMTSNEGLAYEAFSERLEPTPGNGCASTCWALSHHVTTVSLKRVSTTPSRITAEQLDSIRRRIALALGSA
jgi:mRNA-degrading endonuclease toxin of MazEF toxin-antitoxin module